MIDRRDGNGLEGFKMNFLLFALASVLRGWTGANYILMVWFFYDSHLVVWERKANRVFAWFGFILGKLFLAPELMIIGINIAMAMDKLPVGRYRVVDGLTSALEHWLASIARDNPLLVWLYNYSVRAEAYYAGSGEVKSLFTTKIEKHRATGAVVTPQDIKLGFALLMLGWALIMRSYSMAAAVLIVGWLWRVVENNMQCSAEGTNLADGTYYVNNGYFGITITSAVIQIKGGRGVVQNSAILNREVKNGAGQALKWFMENGNIYFEAAVNSFKITYGNVNQWLTTMAGTDYVVMLTVSRAKHVRDALEHRRDIKVFDRRGFLEAMLKHSLKRGNLRIELGVDGLSQIIRHVLDRKKQQGWNIEILAPGALNIHEIDDRSMKQLMSNGKKTLVVARKEAGGLAAVENWENETQTYDQIIFIGDWQGVAGAAVLLRDNGKIYIKGKQLATINGQMVKMWKSMSKKKKMLAVKNHWNLGEACQTNNVGNLANANEMANNITQYM